MPAIDHAPTVSVELIIPVREEDRWKQVPQRIEEGRAAVLVDEEAVGLHASVLKLWILGDQHTQYNYSAAVAVVDLGGQRGVLFAAIERYRPDPIFEAVSHRFARRTLHVPEGRGRFRAEWAFRDGDGCLVEHVMDMAEVDERIERVLRPLDTSLDREGWRIRPEAVSLWYDRIRPEVLAALDA